MARRPVDDLLQAVKANLFPAAHDAIADWRAFPWHRWRGQIQTNKIRSSQALAIDVFGTIKVSPERDRVLAALARRCGVPEDGPWELELEWIDAKNLLREPTPTQVDAVAFGAGSVLVMECKFTEPGGGCSQTDEHIKGLRQCNGNYELQTNPINCIEARCALTGKEIGYWKSIPDLFGLDADQDYRPCPFRGEAYQWMRNVVLARALASDRGMQCAVVAAYADAPGLYTAKKILTGGLGQPGALGESLVTPISYQTILAIAQTHCDDAALWKALADWVQRKIRAVAPN